MREDEAKRLFGERLRTLRQARGMSQERLGEAAGLDRTYVSSAERGARNVTLGSICKFAEALGVEPRDLLPPDTDL